MNAPLAGHHSFPPGNRPLAGYGPLVRKSGEGSDKRTNGDLILLARGRALNCGSGYVHDPGQVLNPRLVVIIHRGVVAGRGQKETLLT